MHQRRLFLTRAGQLAVAGALPLGLAPAARAVAPVRVAISVPGPGNLLFLPITLASKIGADQAEGLELDIRYIGGGPQAFRAMLDHNSDFAAGGLSALALQKLNGKPVACIVPTSRVPAYTLLVRADLRGKIKSISDLRGKVVGVKGHVPGGRSTSQLFTEYLLLRAGIPPGQVNYVAAGQSYDSQHATLVSGAVDAIMGDEPFASRLVRQKVAFALADFHDPQTTRQQMGGLFLNGMVATRDDMIVSQPAVVEKMVKTVQRALVWIASHPARDMVEALAPASSEERATLLAVLNLRKNIYSPDGRFSGEQLDTVERFLHATEKTPDAQAFRLRSVVDARWAGSQA